MSSMQLLNFYVILIIVLVVVLFVLLIVLVVFRESFEEYCCRCHRTRSNNTRRQAVPSTGLRNLAFDDQEYPGRLQLPEQRPFNSMESVESPPSYEEAVKQELFRFRQPLTDHRDRSHSLNDIILSASALPLQPVEESAPSEDQIQTDSPQSPDASGSATGSSPGIRKRGSSSSITLTSQLSTISEEAEDRPVTVVIDRIGIQAARLMENCQTEVKLANGSELGVHSNC